MSNDTDPAELRQRLAGSPALAAAIREQIEGGLLERMGVTAQIAAGDDGGLESNTTTAELEAIIQRVGRPPMLIQNDRVQFGTGADDSLADFPVGTDALIAGTEQDIPSVGRIEFVNFRMAWGGTGWVIGHEGADRVIVTNRHVAGLVARRTIDGRGVFMRDASQIRYGAAIDFKEEFGCLPGAASTFSVVEVIYLADTTAPDVALMRITGANLPSALTLADTEVAVGDLAAIIGYPAYDDRNDKGDMARYFRDLYNVKRYAPGFITQPLTPAIGGQPALALSHDCTSLGGNSGSPVIRLTDGKVVGLHYSGEYGKENRAVGVATLRALLAGQRPIAVTLAAGGLDAAAQEVAGDGVHSAADLAGRPGYDPAFLGNGLQVPWPGLPANVLADIAKPGDAKEVASPWEIRYTHFGVRFSKTRRQPVMTAVNIDGLHKVPITRSGDRWFKDARIPLEIQLRQEDYRDESIDRGHMVRREDPNWDPALPIGNPDKAVTPLATQANFDTFHYTNAAPQHSDLNRDKTRWLGLEDYILNSARTKGFRACVFSGPVVRDDDPEIEPGVIAPQEFWKLVVMENADTNALHATAYVLSQGQMIRDLLEARSKVEGLEGFVLGDFKSFQISVTDLQAATGYDFSAYPDFDPLQALAGAQEAMASGEPVYLVIDSDEQIIL